MKPNKKSQLPFSEKEEREEKTYSYEEVEKLIAERVDEALKNAKSQWDKDTEQRITSERDDATRIASMSADERAKEEMKRRESAFEDERKKYMSEKMEFEATKALANENLPVSFARILSGADIDKTTENVNLFKTEFLKAIEEALNERLKGKTPKTSSVVENNDPFLAGFGM